jgi:hypothetical protein
VSGSLIVGGHNGQTVIARITHLHDNRLAKDYDRNAPAGWQGDAEGNAKAIAAVPNLLAQNAALAEALRRIAEHEYRADRRHRGMVDVTEVEGLIRTARTALAAAQEGGAA